MPVVFRHSGLRYYSFSIEGQPPEPPHVHIKGGGQDAEIWLAPEISIADSCGFNPRELSNILRTAAESRDLIPRAWHDRSATSVSFDEPTMWAELTDGRPLGVPRLVSAAVKVTPPERERMELSRVGLHWEALDEDISIAGLLAGRGDVTRSTEPGA